MSMSDSYTFDVEYEYGQDDEPITVSCRSWGAPMPASWSQPAEDPEIMIIEAEYKDTGKTLGKEDIVKLANDENFLYEAMQAAKELYYTGGYCD